MRKTSGKSGKWEFLKSEKREKWGKITQKCLILGNGKGDKRRKPGNRKRRDLGMQSTGGGGLFGPSLSSRSTQKDWFCSTCMKLCTTVTSRDVFILQKGYVSRSTPRSANVVMHRMNSDRI